MMAPAMPMSEFSAPVYGMPTTDQYMIPPSYNSFLPPINNSDNFMNNYPVINEQLDTHTAPPVDARANYDEKSN